MNSWGFFLFMDHSLEISAFRALSTKTSPLVKYEYTNRQIQL